jgi:hypothetical protein
MEMYMVEVFKTNVRQRRQAKMLLGLMERQFPMLKINFDLEDCDKVLRVEGENICQKTITTLVAENGYQCEILE